MVDIAPAIASIGTRFRTILDTSKFQCLRRRKSRFRTAANELMRSFHSGPPEDS